MSVADLRMFGGRSCTWAQGPLTSKSEENSTLDNKLASSQVVNSHYLIFVSSVYLSSVYLLSSSWSSSWDHPDHPGDHHGVDRPILQVIGVFIFAKLLSPTQFSTIK